MKLLARLGERFVDRYLKPLPKGQGYEDMRYRFGGCPICPGHHEHLDEIDDGDQCSECGHVFREW